MTRKIQTKRGRMFSEKLNELKRRVLCASCVGEAYLKDEVEAQGRRRKCFYCGEMGRCFTLEAFSARVEQAFEDHFQRTATEPDSFQYAMMKDRESTYDWSREGRQTTYAIMDAAEIPEGAASDIQQILENKHDDFDLAAMGEEAEFDSEAHYEEKSSDDADWQAEWRDFERSLKREARFFNQSGAAHLASIFKEIETMETRQGRRVVVDAGPSTPITGFFRARVFDTPNDIEEALISPDRSIGPPPSAKARAGRMNAHGISVFYGADDPAVALAEVRPPVGSWAIVARFEVIRPIRLLDLTALVDIATQGSFFDSQYKHRLGRAKFLRSLSQRLTLPVMPDDEPFEYLTTQAIADFLATDSHTAIDGILFPSVQVAGTAGNVVLFHKAAAVQQIEFPVGTKVTANAGYATEEGWEFDFTVWEEAPEAAPIGKAVSLGFEHVFHPSHRTPWSPPRTAVRLDTLKVDLGSVRIHEIKAVAFTTDNYPVARHRLSPLDNAI